jgi:hypothetical protein
MVKAIRFTLTAALIYFIFQETGWATATFAVLMAIQNEAAIHVVRNLTTGDDRP